MEFFDFLRGFKTIEDFEAYIIEIYEKNFAIEDSKRKKIKYDSSRLVNQTQLSLELGVSRQTIYNWRKSPKTGHIFKPFMIKIGEVFFYRVDAVKQAIIDNKILFGNDRDYNYKKEPSDKQPSNEQPSDEQRSDERPSDNQEKINVKYEHLLAKMRSGQQSTTEERAFFLPEYKLRNPQR